MRGSGSGLKTAVSAEINMETRMESTENGLEEKLPNAETKQTELLQ